VGISIPPAAVTAPLSEITVTEIRVDVVVVGRIPDERVPEEND
jgi:hypothetical protein